MSGPPDGSALREREQRARAGILEAAHGLRDAIARDAGRLSRDHPWALPIAGFCAGFLLPSLLPGQRPDARAARRFEPAPPSRIGHAWAEARSAAADSLASALAALVRRLLDASATTPTPESRNGFQEE